MYNIYFFFYLKVTSFINLIYKDNSELNDNIDKINVLFISFYIFEAVLKLIGKGFYTYFQVIYGKKNKKKRILFKLYIILFQKIFYILKKNNWD
jgi:hypothetical protein